MWLNRRFVCSLTWAPCCRSTSHREFETKRNGFITENDAQNKSTNTILLLLGVDTAATRTICPPSHKKVSSLLCFSPLFTVKQQVSPWKQSFFSWKWVNLILASYFSSSLDSSKQSLRQLNLSQTKDQTPDCTRWSNRSYEFTSLRTDFGSNCPISFPTSYLRVVIFSSLVFMKNTTANCPSISGVTVYKTKSDGS